MNLHLYWSALAAEHRQSMSTSRGVEPIDQTMALLLAGLGAVATLIMVTAGGYQVGFAALYGLGRFLPTAFVEFLSKFGESLAAVCLVALFAKHRPRVVWMAVLASGYTAALTYAIKRSFDAARPPAVLGDWVATSDSVLRMHSFPSGHTATAFLLAACLSVGATKSTRLLLFAAATAVGVSRTLLGVHWPVDVVAGAAVAGLSVFLAIRTMRFSTWGLGVAPHLSFIALIAICAVLELVTGPPGLLDRLLRFALATTALAVLVRDYVVQPLLSARVSSTPIVAASKRV